MNLICLVLRYQPCCVQKDIIHFFFAESIKINEKFFWWKFLHFSHIVCKFPLELTEQNQTNSRMIFEILGFKTKRFSLDPDEPPIPTVISGNKKWTVIIINY